MTEPNPDVELEAGAPNPQTHQERRRRPETEGEVMWKGGPLVQHPARAPRCPSIPSTPPPGHTGQVQRAPPGKDTHPVGAGPPPIARRLEGAIPTTRGPGPRPAVLDEVGPGGRARQRHHVPPDLPVGEGTAGDIQGDETWYGVQLVHHPARAPRSPSIPGTSVSNLRAAGHTTGQAT